MEKLHKKAHLIGALKMEKGKDPCKISDAYMCANCAIRGHKNYEACLPLALTRKQRKTLIKRLEQVNYPVPFKTVESARHLVAKLLFKC